MHYFVLGILEDGKLSLAEIEERVEAMMAPYGNGIHWDWYQIGGRWTGTFDGYNPNKDPKNIHTCEWCKGTGKRTDMVVENGCNGCGGTGKAVKWPSDWKTRKGDTLPVKKLQPKHLKHACGVCCEGYGWFGGDEYLPWKETPEEKFQQREAPPLDWIKKAYPKGVAVVIDCHN